MKQKNSRQAAPPPGLHPFEFAVILLPWLALTPNFFVIPDLTYPGLATQEVVFAVAAAVCAGLGLIKAFGLRAGWRIDRHELLLAASLLLFCLWQLLSLVWTADWNDGARVVGIWFGFALFFLLGALRLSERGAHLTCWSLIAAAFILAGSQFYEYVQFGPEQMLGVFFNHGITAELLALLLPLFLTIYLGERRSTPLTVAAFAAVGLSAGAILLTLRRGALLGVLVAGLGILLALTCKQLRAAHRNRLLIVGGAVVLLLAPVLIFKREAVLSRLRGAVQLQTATESRATELGLTSRAVKWLTAWEMGKRHPLLGVGNGAFAARYGEYRRYFEQNARYAAISAAAEAEDFDEIRSPLAHSEYLQIFAELGVPGLLLCAAFWVLVVRRLWGRRTTEPNHLMFGALFGLLSYALSSALSAFSFRYTPSVFMLACVLGIGLARAPEPATDARGITLPKWAAVTAGVIALLACLALLGRNYDVYTSQRTQSRLDFRFALNNEAANEGLARRYQQVLELDPGNAGAHLGYGLLLFQMKRIPDSIRHAEYAVRHGYNRPYGHVLLAFGYEQNNELERAAQTMAACVASFPKSMMARTAYAELLRKQGKIDEYRQQRARSEQADPILARSWELVFRMKDAAAVAEAQKNGLYAPSQLEPLLARVLVQARAFHYLK